MPYTAANQIDGDKVLVLAPYSGDEVFGCGGAILRHVAGGDSLQVSIVTDGESSSGLPDSMIYSQVRGEGSLQAAKILGYGTPNFWKLPPI